jgi:hypothetical protein
MNNNGAALDRSTRTFVTPRKSARPLWFALYTLFDEKPLPSTIDALKMIDAPSGISASAFCTVKTVGDECGRSVELSHVRLLPDQRAFA